MTQNIGALDRWLRIIAGFTLLGLVFIGPQTPWGWLGFILLATALVSWCPIYLLFGASTCRKE